MKIPKIPKKVVWAGIALIVLIVASLALAGLVALDVMSNLATGSETLKPDGAATGKALVVYNPGLSGAPKDAATKIANDLNARGYEVVLAGVRSTAATSVSGYDVIVAGGPIYGGVVSSSVQSYLKALVPPDNAKVGAFAIGGSTLEKSFPDAVWLKVTMLFSPEKGMDEQRAEFVAKLLE